MGGASFQIFRYQLATADLEKTHDNSLKNQMIDVHFRACRVKAGSKQQNSSAKH